MPNEYIPVEPERNQNHYQVLFHQIFPFPHETTKHYPEKVANMISQLHPSLWDLVGHIKSPATEQEFTTSLEANQIICIASDGGAIPGRVSYGWKIQIGNTPIAKEKGPMHGDDPRSF
jgi:hypothetical protein